MKEGICEECGKRRQVNCDSICQPCWNRVSFHQEPWDDMLPPWVAAVFFAALIILFIVLYSMEKT